MHGQEVALSVIARLNDMEAMESAVEAGGSGALIRQTVTFMREAVAGERASAVRALARVYFHADLSARDRLNADAALTLVLDDPSDHVRMALAEAVAHRADAPRHLVLALIGDQCEIASRIAQLSPLLLDSELVELLAREDARLQCAIASRRPLSAAVGAAIAEIGSVEACAALLENDAAQIAVFSLARLAERHGEEAVIRELLLARDDLPVGLRQGLIVDLSNVLGSYLAERSWLSASRAQDVTRDALDQATIELARLPAGERLNELVAHLDATGQLTPVLMLRALCSGGIAFTEAVFLYLTGLPAAKVASMMKDAGGDGFRALYRRSHLPTNALAAFEVALSTIWETSVPDRPGAALHFSRQVLERILTRYQGFVRSDSDHLLLLLRRFAMAAAREEAQAFARQCEEETLNSSQAA